MTATVNALINALDLVSDPVLIVDADGLVVHANQRAGSELEHACDALTGRPVAELCTSAQRSMLETALARCRADGSAGCSPAPLFGDGDARNELRLHYLSEDGLTVIVRPSNSHDEHSATELDQQDPVTGLLNRRSLPLIVERELRRARRSGKPPIAVLFVMLHDFKQINQMHGHQVGDLLLENTGIRIRESVRKSDFVFRWEGTNLVVLLPELATRLDALIVAEKIHSAVTVPYRFRGLDLAPGCHVGVAVFPDDADSADELFNRANSAVIEAEQRAEACRYYSDETHQMASDRLALRTGLQRAFERHELEVYYQPIVHVDGRIAGAEALMRWNHPTRGLLGPGEFIALAENTRLIAPIDKFSLYSACRSLATLADYPEIFITLNISAINLSDVALPTVVAQAIRGSGLNDPSRLKLELTESHTAGDRPNFIAIMEEIQAMGVEVWIDDFGTGQSSLSYLKHLPVSTVKIDKDFVADLGSDATDVDYLKGIVETVRSRNKRVVVEGIGTAAQLDLVSQLEVDFLQGFHFARPMPFSALQELILNTQVLPRA
mgnify:CR=1 FL=1